MTSKESKWIYKLDKVVSHHGEICAFFFTKKGMFDVKAHRAFGESELYDIIKMLDFTPSGRESAVLGFDRIRDVKIKNGIPLEVKNPDL